MNIRQEVLRTLAALGGEGTPGDLVGLVARSRTEVEATLVALIASERVQVKVSDAGDVVYRLAGTGSGTMLAPDRLPAVVRFDRKTLHLVRALDGVLSLAELVEHTGTSVAEAEREMRRLVAWYGGEEHVSLDGHVVYAFPLVMTSVHAPARIRAPRPAWLRSNDPMGEIVRRRLALGRRVTGPTVFDSGDSRGAAAARELETFDRDLTSRWSREDGTWLALLLDERQSPGPRRALRRRMARTDADAERGRRSRASLPRWADERAQQMDLLGERIPHLLEP